MDWFEDTLLPSLERKYRERGKLWLTAKQTAICRRYMIRDDVQRYHYDTKEKRYILLLNHNDASQFGVVDKGDDQCQKIKQIGKPC